MTKNHLLPLDTALAAAVRARYGAAPRSCGAAGPLAPKDHAGNNRERL